MTTFSHPRNRATSTLASPRASGNTSLALAVGTGSLFGSIFPVRVACVRASDSAMVILQATGRTADVLTGCAVLGSGEDATGDLALVAGDSVQLLITAGMLDEVHAAITAAETTIVANTNAIAAKAPLESPTLTGTPTAPTATAGTNTTQVATTAFVLANAGSGGATPPGGSTTQVQYNAVGVFAGSASFTWNNTTTTLAVTGTINATRADSTTALIADNTGGSIADFRRSGTSLVTLQRVGNLGGWIDFNIAAGACGIGHGGAGANTWIAYAAGAGNWFTTALAGDICYRNTTGRMLFGTDSDAHRMAITTTGIIVTSRATSNIPFRVSGVAGQTAPLQDWTNGSSTPLSLIRADGSTKPASLADSVAVNDSMYYSTTQSRMVYKDAAGVANPLY